MLFSCISCFHQAALLIVIGCWFAYVCYVCSMSYNKLKLITRSRGEDLGLSPTLDPWKSYDRFGVFVHKGSHKKNIHSLCFSFVLMFYIMLKVILVMANSVCTTVLCLLPSHPRNFHSLVSARICCISYVEFPPSLTENGF